MWDFAFIDISMCIASCIRRSYSYHGLRWLLIVQETLVLSLSRGIRPPETVWATSKMLAIHPMVTILYTFGLTLAKHRRAVGGFRKVRYNIWCLSGARFMSSIGLGGTQILELSLSRKEMRWKIVVHSVHLQIRHGGWINGKSITKIRSWVKFVH